MKKHLQKRTILINSKNKTLKQLIFIFILICNVNYSQVSPTSETFYTPSGIFDNVFDKDGAIYKLSEITAGKNYVSKSGLTTSNTLLCTSGIFELYFETGCGMENTTITLHNQRRAILCQAFQDISDFINTPLKNAGNTNKVKIWIRSSTALGLPAEAGGGASAFYNIPLDGVISSMGAPIRGIVDSEIWKTIQTGTNSYANTVFPVINTQNNAGFYHGWACFNFAGTVNWNLDYNKYNSSTVYPINYIDFYSTIIHEVTHALGFNSLMNYTGGSNLLRSNGLSFGEYFTRYDKKLKTSSNISLINNTLATGGQMYDFSFNSSVSTNSLYPNCSLVPPVFNGNSGAFNCPTSIKYVGSVTVPVYNPPCFENGSSLSHFEDACYNGNTNDQYFMMSERASGLFAKRTLTTEERQVLCDIGYSINGTFGSTSNFTYKNYGVSACEGITVAGVNDGFTNTSTYAFQGNSGTDITISGILNNDYTGGSASNLRFEFVQDLYDPNAIFSNITTTSFIFKSFVPGVHLLRYVPYDIITGQRGNITYIYVNVLNNCSVNNPCNLVRNGDFESHNYAPNYSSQIYKACGWQNASYLPSCDYFNSDATNTGLAVPLNNFGNQTDKITGNHAYAGMFIAPNRPAILENIYSESIKTELSTPLLPNTQYRLTFDVSMADNYLTNAIKFQVFITDTNLELTTGGIIPISNITSDKIFLTNSTFSGSNSSNVWETITFTFTTGSNPNLKYLYIGGLNNVQFQGTGESYYYLDNVSLTRVLAPNFLDAINDNFSLTPISSNFGGVTTSVYTNDLYNGVASSSASLPNVTFALVAPLSIAGATINSAGIISIPAGTLAGSYTLTYRLSTVGNCITDTATVTIFVSSCEILIDAVNDDFSNMPINTTTGGVTPSVYSNDSTNGMSYILPNSNANFLLISPISIPGATINNLGLISIPANTPAGSYTLTYSLKGLSKCAIDTATVTIVIYNPNTTPPLVAGIRANNVVKNIELQSNNKSIISGNFTMYNNISRPIIARLNTDLTLDQSFSTSGHFPNQSSTIPYDLCVQTDDKIIIVGYLSGWSGGSNGFGIARLLQNGTLDTSFNTGGIGFSEKNTYSNKQPFVITKQNDGKLLVGGDFYYYNGAIRQGIVRLNSNGSLDISFIPVKLNDYYRSYVTGITIQNDGKILILGVFQSNVPGTTIKNILRLNSDGTIDSSFLSGETTGTSIIWDFRINLITPIQKAVIQPDGKIILAGAFNKYNNINVNSIVRLNSDGSIDNSFSTSVGVDRAINELILEQGTNKPIIAGEFTTFGTSPIKKLIRLTTSGALDINFNIGAGTTDTVINPLIPYHSNFILALKQQIDGKIIVGGKFLTFNGLSATNITRIFGSAGLQARGDAIELQSEPEIDITLGNKITIYPNPSNGIYYFNLTEVNFDTQIIIFNILGEQVFSSLLIGKQENKIDISNLAKGCYLVKLSNAENTTTQKLIKN